MGFVNLKKNLEIKNKATEWCQAIGWACRKIIIESICM
jgi:hypothetical protein